MRLKACATLGVVLILLPFLLLPGYIEMVLVGALGILISALGFWPVRKQGIENKIKAPEIEPEEVREDEDFDDEEDL